jgi:hypothetical protein
MDKKINVEKQIWYKEHLAYLVYSIHNNNIRFPIEAQFYIILSINNIDN